ncbi:CASTOR/POLLUX-related putative ion channel [Allocatelliglobosispora scoriae]|nr:potassium transporter TrkA [Allocatelliglobosispora scoriae]
MRMRDRLRSWFDSTMDRGTPALIGWLGLASLLLVLVVTALVTLFASDKDRGDHPLPRLFWDNMMRAIDPGTMGADVGDPVFLGLMLAVTIGGIFLVSSLIGVITAGLENRIQELRKGRSRVIDTGHTVILGWSDQVFVVISELVKANASGKRSRVVVLADQDKVGMEDQIKARVGDLGRTRVICRSGSPLKRVDLELTSLDTARSVMVLSPAGDDADIDVIKVLLLLNNRVWSAARPNIVAAVQDTLNLAAARLAAGPDAQLIDADDIAVRLVAQSHRQSGLSTVCTDLLDFSGNEIYMHPEPALVGRPFGDSLSSYELGCPIGLLHADGTVAVNPPMSTVIAEGDKIIVIAEDDLLVRLAEVPAAVDESAISTEDGHRPSPDRTLLVGWNSRAPRILDLLDRLVEPGSTVDVAAPQEPIDALAQQRTNLTLGFKPCDPTSRRALEELDLGSYLHIIVLSDDTIGGDHADDRTLVTLLHLRDIEVKLGDPYSIITEMNDDANREVAQITKADDFIVSNMLISLLMTQLAENKHLHGVFADLFDPSGSEIQLKPAADYLRPGAEATFATVAEAARRKDETPIGYRLRRNHNEAPHYGVVLNPPKSEPLTLTADDHVIVIAVA